MNISSLIKLTIMCFTFSTLIFYNCSSTNSVICFDTETKETNYTQSTLDNVQYRQLVQKQNKQIEELKKELKTEKEKDLHPKRLFALKHKQTAMENEYVYGIPHEITLGQAILESNAGRSSLAIEGYNFHGIKCGNSYNNCIEKMTHEYVDGKRIKKIAKFRKYESVEQGFEAHAEFLQKTRYAQLKSLKLDYKGWAYGLKKAGYATDIDYASKLIDVIENYVK
jgi:flagellum-specific peptidoglycan hydrolase FlgJ